MCKCTLVRSVSLLGRMGHLKGIILQKHNCINVERYSMESVYWRFNAHFYGSSLRSGNYNHADEKKIPYSCVSIL